MTYEPRLSVECIAASSPESQIKYLLALSRVQVAKINSLELELKSRDLNALVQQDELDKKLRSLERAERELNKVRKQLTPKEGGFWAWLRSLRPSFGKRKSGPFSGR